jgi:hypothetical protein
MKRDIECGGVANHKDHICMLRVKGMTKEIESVSNNPTVRCFTCGEKANSPGSLCLPCPLDSTFQIPK